MAELVRARVDFYKPGHYGFVTLDDDGGGVAYLPRAVAERDGFANLKKGRRYWLPSTWTSAAGGGSSRLGVRGRR